VAATYAGGTTGERADERRRARLSATFAELQIDCEEDRVLRVLVGMLREDEKRR
jgi:hypothetical protein